MTVRARSWSPGTFEKNLVSDVATTADADAVAVRAASTFAAHYSYRPIRMQFHNVAKGTLKPYVSLGIRLRRFYILVIIAKNSSSEHLANSFIVCFLQFDSIGPRLQKMPAKPPSGQLGRCVVRHTDADAPHHTETKKSEADQAEGRGFGNRRDGGNECHICEIDIIS
jgi:hypothetical protein